MLEDVKKYKYLTWFLQAKIFIFTLLVTKMMIIKLKLPKTSAYVKSYDGQTVWMCFVLENDALLETSNGI